MGPTDVIPNLPVSPGPQTPPSSPNLPPRKQALHSEQVQLLVDLLKAAQAIQAEPAAAEANQLEKARAPSGDDSVSREKGSKLEVKSVVEVYVLYPISFDKCWVIHRWNSKIHEYRLKKPSPVDDVSELEEYVFIIRI